MKSGWHPTFDLRAVLRLVAAVWVGVAMLALMPEAVRADPKFPALTGRIVDDARLLSADDKLQVEATLKELESKSSDQIVVYTAPSLQGYEIEEFGYRLGRFWKLGQQGTNNGALLVVAPNERKVRIEVGRGLEPILTDALTSTIIQNTILPGFRRGDFPGAIKAGVRDLKDALLGDGAEVEKRARSLRQPADANIDWVPLIIFGVFLALFLYQLYGQYRQAQLAGSGNPNAAKRRSGNGGVVVVPGGWGSSGGWSGGGWSSGGDGGGGFSGGGGDFGGGGSSGSW